MNAPGSRGLRRLLIAVVVVGGAYLVARALVSRDEPPPPGDTDLRPRWRDVPEDENGLFPLLFADPRQDSRDSTAPVPTWPEESDRVHGTSNSFDPEAARALLESQRAALQKVDQSLDRPRFAIPRELWEANPNAHAWDVNLRAWGSLGRLLLTRCRLRFEDGNPATALDDALGLVRLGHRVARAQGGVAMYLAGSQLLHGGLEALFWLIRHAKYGAESLRAPLALLSGLIDRGSGLESALRVDYLYMRRTLDGMAGALDEGGAIDPADLQLGWLARLLPSRALLKPNETRRKLQELYSLAIDWTGRSHVERQRAARQLMEESAPSLGASLLNAVGDTLVAVNLSSIPSILHTDSRLRFHTNALRVLLALRAHESLHGELPESLDRLVPEFLDAVPTDPIDDEPLRYSRQKRIVYSIGADSADLGGSIAGTVEDALADMLEPTFRLPPVPEPGTGAEEAEVETDRASQRPGPRTPR